MPGNISGGKNDEERPKTEHCPAECRQPFPTQGTAQLGLLLTEHFASQVEGTMEGRRDVGCSSTVSSESFPVS